MVFNIINASDVRPGDHLYRYRWFKIQQGIAVRFPKLSPIFVISSYKNELILETLNEFKGKSCLRRVAYKQKPSTNRPPDEIVQNAILLLDWNKTSPDRVRTLFANDLSQFARKCCTTVHEQWQKLFHPAQDQTSSHSQFVDKEKISCSSNIFNVALMCGMPFRQASQIGKDEFWCDKSDENCSLLTKKDFETQLSSFSETMIFSPVFSELSSDDDEFSSQSVV